MKNLISYIKFLLKSTNQHGVHSPFVYKLTTKCFYKKKRTKGKEVLKKYRKKLLNNTESIKITDFGAGSRVFKSDKRAIKKIVKYAAISSKRANLLSEITHYFAPVNILEIGTSLGIATAALHAGNPKAKITTLEGSKITADIARKQFDHFSFQNIDVIIGEFSKNLTALKIENSLDLVYFNAKGQKKATLEYFEYCLNFINNDSFFIFNDIHRDKEMEAAWKDIQNHPSVKVTIDTFQWGFVFFRREQEKEHFIIRV